MIKKRRDLNFFWQYVSNVVHERKGQKNLQVETRQMKSLTQHCSFVIERQGGRQRGTFQPHSGTSVVAVSGSACVVKFDASFSPVYSHNPLHDLISHFCKWDVALIFFFFLIHCPSLQNADIVILLQAHLWLSLTFSRKEYIFMLKCRQFGQHQAC